LTKLVSILALSWNERKQQPKNRVVKSFFLLGC
jgi:hypothetical protein